MTDFRARLGARIAEIRNRAGYSQRKAAAVLKMSPATVFRVEKGESWPEWENLTKFSGLYNAEIDEFFEGLDPTDAPAVVNEDLRTSGDPSIGDVMAEIQNLRTQVSDLLPFWDIIAKLPSLKEDELRLIRNTIGFSSDRSPGNAGGTSSDGTAKGLADQKHRAK